MKDCEKEEERDNLYYELESMISELISQGRNKDLYIDICCYKDKLILKEVYKEGDEIILCTNSYDILLEDLTINQLYDLYDQIVIMF